ncbi:MAG: phytanoyl-CoA dioxygenase family protein, partial [Deltaproteobacteria bacterium]|nr:phytanoyl-CoA dioxygenase family protein [Deltaproteobacteria bacterium]
MKSDGYLRLLDFRAQRLPIRTTPAARLSQGGTQLHAAVAGGDFQRAVELLAADVDVSAADSAGHTALSPEFARPEIVHAIRQAYQTTPRSGSSREGFDSPILREVSEKGIVKLPGFVEPAVLEQLQRDFSEFVDRLDARVRRGEGLYRQYHEEEHFWKNDGAYISNNAFKHSPSLVNLACHPSVLELARQHFGKRVHVQRAGCMRYLTGGRMGNDMFRWHHDLEGRQLKLMVLMTEVLESDHTMSYVCRSHKIDHPLHRFRDNRLSLVYCSRFLGELEILQTTGAPGDAYIFNSNGTHMGNRRENARSRDVFMLDYNSDPSNVYGGDIPPDSLQ